MERERLIEWLNNLIEGRKMMLSRLEVDGCESLRCIEVWDDNPAIHLNNYKLMPEIADTLGVPLHYVNDGTDSYPHQRSFTYKGIKFFAQSQEVE